MEDDGCAFLASQFCGDGGDKAYFELAGVSPQQAELMMAMGLGFSGMCCDTCSGFEAKCEDIMGGDDKPGKPDNSLRRLMEDSEDGPDENPCKIFGAMGFCKNPDAYWDFLANMGTPPEQIKMMKLMGMGFEMVCCDTCSNQKVTCEDASKEELFILLLMSMTGDMEGGGGGGGGGGDEFSCAGMCTYKSGVDPENLETATCDDVKELMVCVKKDDECGEDLALGLDMWMKMLDDCVCGENQNSCDMLNEDHEDDYEPECVKLCSSETGVDEPETCEDVQAFEACATEDKCGADFAMVDMQISVFKKCECDKDADACDMMKDDDEDDGDEGDLDGDDNLPECLKKCAPQGTPETCQAATAVMLCLSQDDCGLDFASATQMAGVFKDCLCDQDEVSCKKIEQMSGGPDDGGQNNDNNNGDGRMLQQNGDGNGSNEGLEGDDDVPQCIMQCSPGGKPETCEDGLAVKKCVSEDKCGDDWAKVEIILGLFEKCKCNDDLESCGLMDGGDEEGGGDHGGDEGGGDGDEGVDDEFDKDDADCFKESKCFDPNENNKCEAAKALMDCDEPVCPNDIIAKIFLEDTFECECNQDCAEGNYGDDEDKYEDEMDGFEFTGCDGLAKSGMCNDDVAEALGIPNGMVSIMCCQSCSGAEDVCADNDEPASMLAKDLGYEDVTTCNGVRKAHLETADLCKDEGEYAPFKHFCCRACNPPAAVVVVTVPASMTIVIEKIPAADSPEMLVLVSGLEIALEKNIKNENPDAEVTIISINGVKVNDSRRLADVDVKFEITLPTMCDDAECSNKPDAAAATAMSEKVSEVLIAATSSDSFAEILSTSLAIAEKELKEKGAIGADVVVETVEVAVEAVVVAVDEVDIGTVEEYVPEGEEEEEEEDKDEDKDEEIVDGGGGAASGLAVGGSVAASVVVGIVGLMV